MQTAVPVEQLVMPTWQGLLAEHGWFGMQELPPQAPPKHIMPLPQLVPSG
jgi:hypothetical protein